MAAWRIVCSTAFISRAFCTCQVHLNKRVTPSFEDEPVKSILRRLTGRYVEKILASRKQGVTVPSYKLMSDEQLLLAEQDTECRAESMLEMPPVMDERQDVKEVIELDERLVGYDNANLVITDVSPSVTDRTRRIVVREYSGCLRMASWSERDRMNFIYFPKKGRKWDMPEMLTESGLKVPLSQNRHEDVLDLICLQCEPDSADYIRVHQRVYENINPTIKFELLRSTCHFGGLVYYLTREKKLNNLLDDLTSRKFFQNAVDVINLHHILHPDHVTSMQARDANLSGMALLRAYLRREGPISSLKRVEQKLAEDDAERDGKERTGSLAMT